jgi:transposase/IS5 family transposase
MRTKTFRPYDQDSLLLMPPSLHDWVDPDGLAAFLNDLVDELDLAPFLAAHDEPRGMPPYHPRLMLKVLLYGYATGVTSSRRIEERLAADIGFMFLAGLARPDHKTIAEFRRRHLAAFEGLFLGALRLCQAAGLAKLGRVAIDGTKLKANASVHKAMSYARMAEREAALEAEVRSILDEAEAVDRAEDRLYGDARGDELPPELRRREARLARIREAKAALEAEARERTGDPEAVPEQKAQRNFSDPESRIMHSKPDGWIYGYNAQVAVDEGHQVIVATSLSADTTDAGALPALVDAIETNTGRRPRRVLADAGYASDDNLAHLAERGIDAYVATRRDRHSAKAPSAPRGRIPAGLGRRERMARKLTTKRGRAEYRRRKAIVEPVFGQTKEARGFRRFRLRGRVKVTAEWHLECAVHNLAKLFRSGRAGRVVGLTRAARPASQPVGA